MSSQTLPAISLGEKRWSGSCNSGALKAGAALSTSGEGNSRGLRVRPTANTASRAMKAASGRRNLFMR